MNDELLKNAKDDMIEMVYEEIYNILITYGSPSTSNVEIFINDLKTHTRILQDINAIKTWKDHFKVENKWTFLLDV